MLYGNAVSYKARKRLRRNAATVFELSIAEHAQRAFGGTYNLFCFMETQFPVKQVNGFAVTRRSRFLVTYDSNQSEREILSDFICLFRGQSKNDPVGVRGQSEVFVNIFHDLSADLQGRKNAKKITIFICADIVEL